MSGCVAISGSIPTQWTTELSNKLPQIFEVITQIFIRIFFVSTSILMAATVFPISVHQIVVSSVAIGATSLSAFFYPQLKPLRKVRLPTPDLLIHHDSLSKTIGLVNNGNQCALISFVQTVLSDPPLMQWFLNPLSDQISLDDFITFFRSYHPADEELLFQQFRNYLENLPHPLPSIPMAFIHFLDTVLPPRDYHPWKDMRDICASLNAFHPRLRNFFQAVNECIQRNLRIADTDMQNLREILHEISPHLQIIKPTDTHPQVDPHEAIIEVLMPLLPAQFKLKVRTSYEIDTRGRIPHPPPQPRTEMINCLQLRFDDHDIVNENKEVTIEEMIQKTLNKKEQNDSLYKPGNGEAYPILRSRMALIEPPDTLRFQLVRFGNIAPPKSWCVRWLPFFFKPLPYQTIKIEKSVNVKDEILFPMENGEMCRYKLVSFIRHLGSSMEGGHYKAGRIVDGDRYLMDDSRTIYQDQDQDWKENLNKAYLLNYVRIPPQAPA